MKRYVLRLWLPDVPGALGRVAGALGSVDASLTGIDILDRGAGWAIDELVVELANNSASVDQLVDAISQVEGVKIEDIRAAPSDPVDPRVDALESAAQLIEQRSASSLREMLVDHVLHDLSADWVALSRLDAEDTVIARGAPPSAAWLSAFVAGSRSAGASQNREHGPSDIAWAELTNDAAALIVGRDGRPFHARERRQLDALVRIADQRLSDLSA